MYEGFIFQRAIAHEIPPFGSIAGLSEDSVSVAKLALIIPRMTASLKLFNLLWAHRGDCIRHEAITDLLPAGDNANNIHNLRKMCHRMRWPVSIETVTSIGYRLNVAEDGWSWEDDPRLKNSDIEGAALILAMNASLPRRAAIAMQILWSRRNRTVPISEFSRRLGAAAGRQVTRFVLDDCVWLLRRAGTENRWPAEIICAPKVGYKLQVRDPLPPRRGASK